MIKALTESEYLSFSGYTPEHKIEGVSLVKEGQVLAVAGVVVMEGRSFVVFSEKEGCSKRDIIRGWRVLESTLKSTTDYYAIADQDIQSAHSLLTHFNFEHLIDDVYVYRG